MGWEGCARVCKSAPEMPHGSGKEHRDEAWVGKGVQGCVRGAAGVGEDVQECIVG